MRSLIVAIAKVAMMQAERKGLRTKVMPAIKPMELDTKARARTSDSKMLRITWNIWPTRPRICCSKSIIQSYLPYLESCRDRR